MEEHRHALFGYVLKMLAREGVSDGPSGLMEERGVQIAREAMGFMDELPGGFLIYRADGEEEILFANQALLRIFQCETTEEFQALTGGTFRGMVHPEDLEAVEESIWHQVAVSQYDLDYVEYRIVRKDGTVRWIEDYGHFVRSQSMGNIFYVFLADATEKHAEMLTERFWLLHKEGDGQRELQSLMEDAGQVQSRMGQEHMLRMKVIEALGVNYDSIFYVDLDEDAILPYRLSSRSEGIFEGENRVWPYLERITAYVDRWVCPEDREMVHRAVDPEELRRRLSAGVKCAVNYRAVENGGFQYLQLRFVSVGRQRRASQLVMGCRRVDEELQREMEQKLLLEEALENARLSIVAKDAFLSNMSHDMRTPLNAIFGYTALARKSLPDERQVRDYLDRIDASSRQLLGLIEEVLRLSWTDASEKKTEEAACSLEGILEEVRQFLLPQAQEKNIGFTLDCTGVKHDAIRGDREKLSQLVMYLANNAVTYTPPGGSVSITASETETLHRSCAIYSIAVQDTGIGISEDFLQQIFEPFTRERNTTLSGIHGAGLGLTIAKNITDLLGGNINVESTVDKGSVFTVTLRLGFQAQEPSAAPFRTGPEIRGSRLLLVEDNEINQEIETEILEDLGFQVDAAPDGEAAVEKLRAAPPGAYDLVLMDIQMPVMDGWQAAKAVRALPDPARAGVPIVALSANVFDSDVQKSLDAGMDAHLAKPIDVPVLLETIGRIMERRGTERTE